jgi:rhodanese-related sulfurtransferase
VACEILVATPAVANLIREGKTHQIYSSMQAGGRYGMQTMDMALAQHIKAGRISQQVAFERCHDPEELQRLIEADAVQVLDVREPHERDQGYIPGSRNIPYRLVREWAEDLEGGKPVVTICSTGPRAGVAASVLVAAGVDARPVLHGGVADWDGDTVSFRRCG